MQPDVDVVEPFRIAVALDKLIKLLALPTVDKFSRQPFAWRGVTIEEGVVRIAERPEPGDAPADADGIMEEMTDGSKQKKHCPLAVHEPSQKCAGRKIYKRVMNKIAVGGNGFMIAVAVLEKRIDKINVRKERKGNAEANKERR